jgi:hypothetical protein
LDYAEGMATMSRTTDAATFEMTVDEVETTSFMPTRDPDWTTTDSHGHAHDAGGATFEWVTTAEGFDSDGEEWSEGEYRCLACGEVVTPGLVGPSPFRTFVAGPRHYFIDAVEVSEQEFMERYAAALG